MKIYDVIIIGAGPAGLTSSIYASRANLNTLIIEKKYPGGQMLSTADIENYTGYEAVSGSELSEKMFAHAKKFGTEFKFAEVVDIKIENDTKVIYTPTEKILGRTIIIATGSESKSLNIPGEKELANKGVSFCAVCDGAFFRKKNVVVIGGGDSAIEEALYLSNIVEKVTVVHRRKELRAQKILQDRAFAKNNIDFIYDSIPLEVEGETRVSGVKIKNVITQEESTVKADGVFIYIGMNPQTEIFKSLGIVLDSGYIKTDEHLETDVKGIYVAGDVREKEIRQIVTATSDGAVAAQSAYKYIELGSK